MLRTSEPADRLPTAAVVRVLLDKVTEDVEQHILLSLLQFPLFSAGMESGKVGPDLIAEAHCGALLCPQASKRTHVGGCIRVLIPFLMPQLAYYVHRGICGKPWLLVAVR